MRNRGAVILEASIAGQDVVKVPAVGADTAKPAGSFACMPFGATEKLGGQHGYPRYAPFVIKAETRLNGATLAATMDQTTEAPTMRREIHLGKRSLDIVTHVTNTTSQRVTTSLAEHPYFPLATGDAGDVLINGRGLDSYFGPDATRDINNGIARFGLYLGGGLDIALPGLRLVLGARPGKHGLPTESMLGLVAWKRPDGPNAYTVCFEPTLGVQPCDEGLFNQGLVIPRSASASLHTTIALA